MSSLSPSLSSHGKSPSHISPYTDHYHPTYYIPYIAPHLTFPSSKSTMYTISFHILYFQLFPLFQSPHIYNICSLSSYGWCLAVPTILLSTLSSPTQYPPLRKLYLSPISLHVYLTYNLSFFVPFPLSKKLIFKYLVWLINKSI